VRDTESGEEQSGKAILLVNVSLRGRKPEAILSVNAFMARHVRVPVIARSEATKQSRNEESVQTKERGNTKKRLLHCVRNDGWGGSQ